MGEISHEQGDILDELGELLLEEGADEDTYAPFFEALVRYLVQKMAQSRSPSDIDDLWYSYAAMMAAVMQRGSSDQAGLMVGALIEAGRICPLSVETAKPEEVYQ